MKREYLFKGKRIDNGKWVEGRLIAEDVIVPVGQEFEVEANCIFGCDLTAYQVNPETVGEYTGLNDDNGNKIFEGDIVRVKGGECFDGYYEIDDKFVVKDILDGICQILRLNDIDYIKIAGNIYD